MSELQPGMLALVIGCLYNPHHIGKIVSVVSVEDDSATVTGAEPQDRALLKHLLPIRSEAEPLHEKQKQELHA